MIAELLKRSKIVKRNALGKSVQRERLRDSDLAAGSVKDLKHLRSDDRQITILTVSY